MNDYRPTSLRSALVEQVRTVGLALRLETALLAGVAAILTASALFYAHDSGQPIHYTPDIAFLTAGLGLLLPFAVWKGENIFGGAHLWNLPIDRRRHALVKATAGWVWLMPTIGLVVLWLVLMAVLTGGRLVGEEAREVLVAHQIQTLRWSEPAWMWVVPFTAATLGYLASSALILGLKRRLWWIAACSLVLLFLVLIGEVEGVFNTMLRQLGLDYALTGASDAFYSQRVPPNDETVLVWGGVPTLGRWAIATACWIAAGLVALWIAASRHKEG